jgi:hypothetical protein
MAAWVTVHLSNAYSRLLEDIAVDKVRGGICRADNHFDLAKPVLRLFFDVEEAALDRGAGDVIRLHPVDDLLRERRGPYALGRKDPRHLLPTQEDANDLRRHGGSLYRLVREELEMGVVWRLYLLIVGPPPLEGAQRV